LGSLGNTYAPDRGHPFPVHRQIPDAHPGFPLPSQGSRGSLAEYAEGLEDLEGFSHIFLLYVFHESSGYSLLVKPFLDDQLRGLFATRHPCRPNPIGLSVVRLIARQGNSLEVEGVDTLDGTPLLDIKPYVPDFDVRADTRTGWYATRIE